jgi:hypothetical protein
MTDDQSGASHNELVEAVKSLNRQAIKVISVGLGVHPEIKELNTMATNDENVILIVSDNIKTKKFDNIIKCKLIRRAAWNKTRPFRRPEKETFTIWQVGIGKPPLHAVDLMYP